MSAVASSPVIKIIVDTSAVPGAVNSTNAALARIGQGSGANGANSTIQTLTASLGGASTASSKTAANCNALGSAMTTLGVKASGAAAGINGIGTASTHAGGGVLSLLEHLGKMTIQLAGLGFLAGGVHELAEAFIESANEATEVASRLAVVTKGSNDLATAQANVAAIANSTRQSLTDTAELYQKIGIQADHLGLSQGGVTLATRTFAETLKIAGASQQQAAGSMRQLGEAFDIGKLSGIHYQAMMSDNIVFMRLLAQSMGIPMGKLKELSTQGKVTADDLKKALTDPSLAAEVQKRFDKMPVGFNDVRMAIKNTLVQLAGDFNEGSGLNQALRSLYNNIVDFATSAKPTFEKIGAAFRAAVAEFGPVVRDALALIQPLFGFVLDNAPELIRLVKVAAEGWLAYRAATALVAAVDLASRFLTQAQSLAALMKAATGAGTVMSYLKAGFEAASAGVDVLTAAIAANPLGALALAVTATVGLLYEFRDSINIGGGAVASLGDLMRATWESIGPAISTVVDWVGKLADEITSGLGAAFGWIGGIFTDVFSNFDFSIAGALRAVARFIDYMTVGFKGWWTITTSILSDIPGYFQALFGSAANLALAALEGLANGAKSIVNNIIGGINSAFHTDISLMADVKLGRVDEGGFKKGLTDRLAGITNNHTAESGLEGLFNRANQIHDQRTKPSATGTPELSTPTSPDDSASGKKDKEAEKRAKQEADFWQTLQNELTSAKLFGIELEKQTQEQKLQKILGHDLSTDQQTRVDSMVEEITNTKAITSLKQAQFEAANQYTVESQRTLGLTEQQRAVEDVLFSKRIDALNKGANINSTAYTLAENDLRAQLTKNAALKEQNDLLAKAGDFARKYSSALDISKQLEDMDKQRDAFEKLWSTNGGIVDGQAISQQIHDAIVAGYTNAKADIADQPLITALQSAAKGGSLTAQSALDKRNATSDYNKALTALPDSGLSTADQEKASQQIATDYQSKMLKANRLVADNFANTLADGIKEIGQLFGGVFGDLADKISDTITSMSKNASGSSATAKLFTQIDPQLGAGFLQGSQNMMDLKGGLKNISDPLKDLKEGFTGPQGSIIKGLGQAVGGAMAGYQIGSTVGDIGSLLGANKGFSSGAKIGGTIGGITGNPIIAAGASVIGGLIGSLFSSPKYGTASLTGGDQSQISISGNKSTIKAASGDAGSQVQAGLASLAQQLGGVVGNFSLAIGQWDGKWRVNDYATSSKLHYNNFTDTTLHNFDDDQGAAISYAVQRAIEEGAITGISDFAKKALSALDPDSAVSLVNSYKQITDQLDAMNDPIGAAVRDINGPLDDLVSQMKAVGAGSADLANIEEYRSKKLDEALKDQLSSLNDFMKTLNGEGSGRSSFDRLNSDLSEFKGYQDRIASGDSTVDQSAFTALGQEIFGLAKDVYGTSTEQFQEIRTSLVSASEGLSQNVLDAFGAAGGDTTTAAIQAQTSALVAQIAITNDLLTKLATQSNGDTYVPAQAKIAAVNGAVVDRSIIY